MTLLKHINSLHGYTVHQQYWTLFYYQLMHTTLKNAALLKHSKLDKNAPHRNHLQGAKVSAWLKITRLHFLSWRPYHVTLSNLLDTVYLHTVHDTHALQGKSDFIPLLSNLLFISLKFYSLITYISFITVTVTICSHSTDYALHIFYADTVTKRVIFSQALTLAPWRWFLCKPKHVKRSVFI